MSGMHLLEMAKTAWNAIATETSRISEEILKIRLRVYLDASQDILGVLGIEGDLEGGPAEDIRTLQGLLE
jgi:SET and MYND domain-containing protein